MERPRVIVNVAQSLNGMIAGRGGRKVIISSSDDRVRVHRLRSMVDAVIVGANTVINDNPRLLVDKTIVPNSRSPVRIVLDRKLIIPADSLILDNQARTIIFTSQSRRSLPHAEIINMPDDELKPEAILLTLWKMGMKSVLVEGGKQVIHDFLVSGCVDEFHLFIGNILIEKDGLILFDPPFDLTPSVISTQTMEGGVLISLDPYSLMIAWKT